MEDPIDWKELSERFRKVRGSGVGYHTIQAWQTMGMPHFREGHRIRYDWQECLNWWKMTFAVMRKAG